MPPTRLFCAALLGTALLAAAPPSLDVPRKPLVVHEWGTFTSLQGKDGASLGGINVDDEPVPAFVHRIGGAPDPPLSPALTKGIGVRLPAVTVRLETPVLYFHTSADERLLVRVNARFKGGWLTEYYPDAMARVDGRELTSASFGSLDWSVTLNPLRAPAAPVTDANVWLAPRAVRAAPLATERESERYLFYRGVGHLDAPLRAVWHGRTLLLSRNETTPGGGLDRFPGGWLVDVRGDGSCAYSALSAARWSELPPLPGAFAPDDHARHNQDALRTEMAEALMREGLFADEAKALLATWQESYFASPGLRLFFLVPRSWTDAVLPLQIERADGGRSDVVRVMVGRIEIVTAEHERLIAAIAAGPKTDAAQRAFRQLGRFRVALLRDAAASSPGRSGPLGDFVPIPERP